MNLDFIEREELDNFFEDITSLDFFDKLKRIRIHRSSNVYKHSLEVAKLAYRMALLSPIKVDIKSVIVGAMFHDFYFSSWKEKHDKKKVSNHVHAHPYIALENAEKEIVLSEKEKNIIATHMWPINFFDVPQSKEAAIVSLADKIVTSKEFLNSFSINRSINKKGRMLKKVIKKANKE